MDAADDRRRTDRRSAQVHVEHDRRRGDRRAQRLAPTTTFSGVAVVVDSWPLMRAGIRQMLADSDVDVVGDDVSLAAVKDACADGIDLAILGVTREPLLKSVAAVREMSGPDGDGPPQVLVLLERIDAGELRQLLSLGVAGVVQRTAAMEELSRTCRQVMEGQRVLCGSALSVLASSGLEVSITSTHEIVLDEAHGLTRKEMEVLSHLARHRSNAEIAAQMHLSAATVKTHLSNIYGKLDVPGRRQAVVAAVERGLLG